MKHRTSGFGGFKFSSIWLAKIGLKCSSVLKAKVSLEERSRWMAKFGMDISGRFMCTRWLEIFPGCYIQIVSHIEQKAKHFRFYFCNNQTGYSKISIEPGSPETTAIGWNTNLKKIARTDFGDRFHLENLPIYI